ncbi:unnamed protein product [Caenorhabditis auriculariae]|uniref:Uncharacterized protein n=1 Tax=Caenorhabditis auriculariae TaxID=2777116 RepID=A0A8S1HE64_9PELO|nr:unnamed protein product [Caenorhabditis auriculariae]
MQRITRNADKQKEPKTADVPRRCVVIKKTKLNPDMEKIELRYVVYNRVGMDGKFEQLDVLGDASNFIRERGKDMKYHGDDVATTVTVASVSMEATTTSRQPTDEVHDRQFEVLSRSLPVLQNLCDRFRDLEFASNETHKRSEYGMLREMTEDALIEGNRVISEGQPVPTNLMKKIQGINTIARRVLEEPSMKKMEVLSLDNSEMARSRSETFPRRR